MAMTRPSELVCTRFLRLRSEAETQRGQSQGDGSPEAAHPRVRRRM